METSTAQISSSYEAVSAGYKSGITRDLTYRRSQLRNLYYAILDRENEFKQALFEDLHRDPAETELLELNEILSEIALAIENLDSWAADKPLRGDIRYSMGSPFLRPTPYGVVLIIAPWNYPYLCSIVPIVSAIAAGNTVIFKPSEVVENSTRIMQSVLTSALDPQLLQVVLGGIDESTFLLNELRFDKIMLTGSTKVGKIVAAAAAQRLTPITLELGGKSPTIITASANIDLCSRRLAWAKFVNAGQTCIAPDYILVDSSVADEFVAKFKLQVQRMFADLSKFPHIVSQRLLERCEQLVKTTKGTVWQHGEAQDLFFPPTLVDNVGLEDVLMQEEIFAPIFPIVRVPHDSFFADVDAIVAEHDYPLALYIFSTKKPEQERVLAATRSGAVMINDALMQGASPAIPFGGVGTSGQGRYHGKFGFDEFSFERPVVRQPNWVEKVIEARYPPYTNVHSLLLRLVSRPLRPSFSRSGPVGPWRKYRLVKLLLGVVIAAIAYRLRK